MQDKDMSLNLQPLDIKNKEIAQKILDTETLDEVKDLTAVFNLNNQKRNVLRILKMNNLLDDVTNQIIERFEKNPHNFSNEDLLRYMQVTENAIDRANKNLNMVEDTPPIQMMQNNQVNININQGLDRESRMRVTETVQEILKRLSSNNVDNESIIDVDSKDDE